MQQVAVTQKTLVQSFTKLLRIEQWAKNLFIFIPSFFFGDFFNFSVFIPLVLAFLSFSFVSSSIYILNDYRDIEADQAHPKKRKRPLASGEISKNVGLVVMTILGICGLVTGLLIDPWFLAILLIYVVINIGYS